MGNEITPVPEFKSGFVRCVKSWRHTASEWHDKWPHRAFNLTATRSTSSATSSHGTRRRLKSSEEWAWTSLHEHLDFNVRPLSFSETSVVGVCVPGTIVDGRCQAFYRWSFLVLPSLFTFTLEPTFLLVVYSLILTLIQTVFLVKSHDIYTSGDFSRSVWVWVQQERNRGKNCKIPISRDKNEQGSLMNPNSDWVAWPQYQGHGVETSHTCGIYKLSRNGCGRNGRTISLKHLLCWTTRLWGEYIVRWWYDDPLEH